jgi:hypothetical protein
MFIGHYGPAFAGKMAAKSTPLWVLFVAVQLLDYGWGVLVLLGVEKVKVVPGFTPMSPFDLVYMPYTHSLAGAAIWAVAAGVLYALAQAGKGGWWAAAVVTLAVFSHWLLDLIVHKPDLQIGFTAGGPKLGFGFWDNLPAALALEIGLFLGGLVLYARSTAPKGALGRIMPWVCAAIFVGAELIDVFGPPPPSADAAATLTLVVFTVAAALAYVLDRTRETRGL